MKVGTENHIKVKRLQRALGIATYQAVGILETLWLLTARQAPLGDIGKYTNEDIASYLEWERDPDELIAALVASKWLEECDTYRLTVHDWDEHAPDFIKKRLDREREKRVRKCPPTADNGGQRQTNSDNGRQREEMSENVPLAGANGALAKPSQAKPSLAERECASDDACPLDDEREDSPDDGKPANEQHLDALIDAWNGQPRHICPEVQSRRSKGIVAGWRRVQKHREPRDALSDVDAVMASVRRATWAHGKGWFKFSWLFACGKGGDWNISKLLDGHYIDGQKTFGKHTGVEVSF